MYEIPLEAVPNQQCSVRLEGRLFEITIKQGRGVMLASISRDAKTIVQGVRCLPGAALIPHEHLEDGGNFYFLAQGEAYPHYSRFGSEDLLWYLTEAELKELRDG